MARINFADKVALNTNDSIADINKVNATDMNDIKNAINQGGAYSTATAVTNGDFKTTLVGTLDTNDIIIVSFPTATNGTSNARISIDNGVTYKNILDFVGTNVVASNIQASKRRLLYNGTSFVLDDVDYGSNSNGNYTRYKDRTMICTNTIYFNKTAVNTTAGALYRSAVLTIPNYSMSFVEEPNVAFVVTQNITAGTMTFVTPTFKTGTNIKPPAVYIVASAIINAFEDYGFYVTYQAIGKWK